MADDQITIGISADPSGLQEGMDQACQSVQASLAQLQQLVQQTNAKIDAMGNSTGKAAKAAKAANDSWAKSFAPVQKAFATSINGMILGTTTWQKAVQKITQTVESSLLNATERMLVNWLTKETAETTGTEAGVQARTAAESAGQATGLADMFTSGLKAIGGSAATAAANTYASVSAIPYVGWILAPPAAAAAFAAVMAFGGKMPSAAGGMWSVPSDTLAMIHKQESILPANIAQPMRNFFTNGGAAATSGGGGDSYTISVQAIDTQSGAQFLMNNAGVIAQGLARELRNANTSLRSAMR